MPDQPQLDLQISGWGAVSPAGWDAGSLTHALAGHAAGGPGAGLPVTRARRHPEAPETAVRELPPPPAGVALPRHPRLRRTSPVARHAMAAALQAVGPERIEAVRQGELSLGIVFCVMNGCVQFSRRFYHEVLENPATASPMVFPETVFNSPSSHLSTALGCSALNYTIIGDAAGFFSGLTLARQWLEDGDVEAVLVVAAEEIDWLSAEAVQLFDRNGITAEGAGALLLETASNTAGPPARLTCLPEPLVYGPRLDQAQAVGRIAEALRQHLADDQQTGDPTLLIDSQRGHTRLDRAEELAWPGWSAPKWSPIGCLGEGFAANGAWQCVAACEAIARGHAPAVAVSGVGGTMQVGGAVFRR